MSVPYHLRFLEDLRRDGSGELEDYYPETAAGTLEVYESDELFPAGGLTYVSRGDGTLVPVQADGLEPMEENIWDADKFSALVDAAESGEDVYVHPGYADLWLRDGMLHAQVRDGNHRTFAPIVAGEDFSWVLISDRTRQDLDERLPGTEKLYRAIRAAQRAYGAPQFKRKKWGKVKESSRAPLLEAERRYAYLRSEISNQYRELLRRYGFPESGFSIDEQLRRPQVFWSTRARELREEKGRDWYTDNVIEGPEVQALEALRTELQTLGSELYDMRRDAGLQYGESLDPKTGKIVRGNPNYAELKRKLMK